MSRSQKRIEAARRQVARRAKIQPYQPASIRLTATLSERHAISDSRPDLLLAIESMIQAAHEEFEYLDDRVVRDALECTLRGASSHDPDVTLLSAVLVTIRDTHAPATDEIWHSALRVIRTSVCTVSGCKPGEVSYLKYASKFLEKANRRAAG